MILTPRHCFALMMAAFHVFAQLLARTYAVFAPDCPWRAMVTAQALTTHNPAAALLPNWIHNRDW